MSKMYPSFFQCINQSCGQKYEIDKVIYHCEKCSEILKVQHDYDILKQQNSQFWKNLFDSRFRSIEFPYYSGVWSKYEWVAPYIDFENIITTGEGYTPLFSSKRLNESLNIKNFYIKQCGLSHTGSFKDLGMTVLVSHLNQLIQNGQKIQAVACASSGDTSAALAAYSAKAGIPTIIFLPTDKVSQAQLIQPIANAAIVFSLDTDFDGCMKMVQEVTKKYNIYLANSMNSIRLEGQKTIAIEITQQLGWNVPDWILIPGGNLGNVSALGEGFEMMFQMGLIKKRPRIALAQAENANPLYLSFLDHFKKFSPIQAKETFASAIRIGNPISYKKAIKILKNFDGMVEQASEQEILYEAKWFDKFGFYTDPHTAVALVAFKKLYNQNQIKKENTVVVISTANALKFTDFKLQNYQKEGKIVPNQEMFQVKPCLKDIESIIQKKIGL